MLKVLTSSSFKSYLSTGWKWRSLYLHVVEIAFDQIKVVYNFFYMSDLLFLIGLNKCVN